ncbi:hypothetical protein KBY70_12490 [Cyanobium sp. ATX 6E8]|uniref:hypothetical protein n=1 Tax=Cyanobium sp. ATX 6E8 TaxID=2823701 RepID=UPI0020CF05F7|nr:hypothetical protein [Cyanobium sp. ATX 6E8]MCP9943205.1 hypothetical protein [Cyanobium sp. ATX 6E8]
MGARSLLERRLRRWQQDWESWKQRRLAPLAAPLQRRHAERMLARIRRLERVEQLIWPEQTAAASRMVLFCHYSPRGHLQACVRRLLNNLTDRGWQVLVISSGLKEAGLQWCAERQMPVLLRSNQGRDFGAFQDAWLALAQRGALQQCQQLVLLNDSVYPVVDLETSSWPRFLDGHPDAVVGFTDSFQNGYHLQSYALNIPAAVLQQPWWHGFWWSYPGWGGTAAAIRDGEIGLSQLLLRHGVALQPLHGVVGLRSWLCSTALAKQLLEHCSAAAADLLLGQLLESSDRAIIHVSPSHQFAIPLLLQGFPFIKRDLLESNLCHSLDPLLLAGGRPDWVDAVELVDFLRPPIIGYKQ